MSNDGAGSAIDAAGLCNTTARGGGCCHSQTCGCDCQGVSTRVAWCCHIKDSNTTTDTPLHTHITTATYARRRKHDLTNLFASGQEQWETAVTVGETGGTRVAIAIVGTEEEAGEATGEMRG
jgi:hypothetical protein